MDASQNTSQNTSKDNSLVGVIGEWAKANPPKGTSFFYNPTKPVCCLPVEIDGDGNLVILYHSSWIDAELWDAEHLFDASALTQHPTWIASEENVVGPDYAPGWNKCLFAM